MLFHFESEGRRLMFHLWSVRPPPPRDSTTSAPLACFSSRPSLLPPPPRGSPWHLTCLQLERRSRARSHTCFPISTSSDCTPSPGADTACHNTAQSPPTFVKEPGRRFPRQPRVVRSTRCRPPYGGRAHLGGCYIQLPELGLQVRVHLQLQQRLGRRHRGRRSASSRARGPDPHPTRLPGALAPGPPPGASPPDGTRDGGHATGTRASPSPLT